MSIIVLEAASRTDIGKGASRRLRRLDNKVPAIIYGGGENCLSIVLDHNKVKHALENRSIYSSVFDLKVDGKVEHVILKALQRHPYKPVILHMDLQRVSSKDVLVKNIPLHFLNEDTCKGVKAGGKINHSMIQVEVRCKAADLPEHIDVDLANLELNKILHLSDLKLPKGVALTVNFAEQSHNLPVVSVHLPKVSSETESTSPSPEAGASESTPDTK